MSDLFGNHIVGFPTSGSYIDETNNQDVLKLLLDVSILM